MNDADFEKLAKQQSVAQVPQSTQDRHILALMSLAHGEDVAVVEQNTRRQTRLLAIGIGALVIGGASVGTAAALGTFSTPTNLGGAHCYATADLHDDSNYINFALAAPPGQGLADSAAAAVEICSRDWLAGRFHPTDPKITESDASGAAHAVPPLVVCVLESGQVGVFPGGNGTCERLGLPTAKL